MCETCESMTASYTELVVNITWQDTYDVMLSPMFLSRFDLVWFYT